MTWLIDHLDFFEDLDIAVAMWPVYFTITFLQGRVFEGRRPSPLRQLGGKQAVGEFMKACRSGVAPRGVDRDLWLSVLTQADDGRTYRRRLGYLLVVLTVGVVASVGLGVAAVASQGVPGTIVRPVLGPTLLLGVSIGIQHAFGATRYRTTELRRDLERRP